MSETISNILETANKILPVDNYSHILIETNSVVHSRLFEVALLVLHGNFVEAHSRIMSYYYTFFDCLNKVSTKQKNNVIRIGIPSKMSVKDIFKQGQETQKEQYIKFLEFLQKTPQREGKPLTHIYLPYMVVTDYYSHLERGLSEKVGLYNVSNKVFQDFEKTEDLNFNGAYSIKIEVYRKPANCACLELSQLRKSTIDKNIANLVDPFLKWIEERALFHRYSVLEVSGIKRMIKKVLNRNGYTPYLEYNNPNSQNDLIHAFKVIKDDVEYIDDNIDLN